MNLSKTSKKCTVCPLYNKCNSKCMEAVGQLASKTPNHVETIEIAVNIGDSMTVLKDKYQRELYKSLLYGNGSYYSRYD